MDSFPYDIFTVPLKVTFNAQITEYAPKSTLRYGVVRFDVQHHGSIPFKIVKYLLGGIVGSELTFTSGAIAFMTVFSHLSAKKKF